MGLFERAGRLAAATAVSAVGLWLALAVASLIGWSFEPKGWHRVSEGYPALLLAVGIGGAGLMAGRAILKRRWWSPWLAVAFAAPLWIALGEAGVF